MNKVPVTTSVAALLRASGRASSSQLVCLPSRLTASGPNGNVVSRHSGTAVAVASAQFTRASSSMTSKVSTGAADKYGLAAPAARRAAVLDMVKEQASSHNDAFYVVDLMEIARKHKEWCEQLPRVRPFFAVKCNDDPRIVETLAELGTGFDCASKGEMSMALKLGVNPSDIIFAHPAKQPTHLHYAAAKGVTRMTFDNEDELRKIAKEHPSAEVVLRILTDDSHSVCRLGLKFGAPLSSVQHLMEVAKEVGVKVIGISYHVGSGNGNAKSFGDAVRDARTAFNIAAKVGFDLKLLDIGGGFPGSEMGAENGRDKLDGAADDSNNPYSKHPSFRTIAAVVREALDTHFPAGCGVDIIAEPGRYFVKSSHVLAVNIVGKRKTVDEATGGTRINYYVNDGLYGSFNCVMYDHVTCAPAMVLSESNTVSLSASRAAFADDAIAAVSEDGTPMITDALGLEHADDLRDAFTPAVEAAEAEMEQLSAKRMVVGGSDEDCGSSFSMSAGSALAAAAKSMFASSSSSVAHSSRPSAGAAVTSARRALNFSSLASTQATVSQHPTTIWGPTCDSIDKITDSIAMPEIAVGDWLVFENMGAYTIAGSCKFNGFPLSTKVYLHRNGRVEVQKEEVHE